MHNWFKSYLSDRKQYTVVNKIKSRLENITIGVSQGLVLGPLLFLIYVNDIGYISKNIDDKIMLFADDTNAFTMNKDLNQPRKTAGTAENPARQHTLMEHPDSRGNTLAANIFVRHRSHII